MPCILWADRRCGAEARELGEEFGEDIHQKTGMKPDPYFTAPKLLWFKRNRKKGMRRIFKFLLPKDYIVYRLTGQHSTDWTVASRTMMLDIRTRKWWPEMLEYVGVDEGQLCSPRDSGFVVGEVTAEACRQLRIRGSPVVVAGAGDRQCEAMGSGVSSENAMESTGSATNVSISSDRIPRRLCEGLLYSCHAVPGQYMMEQGIGSTGLALRWFRDNFHPGWGSDDFRADPYGFLDRAASNSPPGANGLTFLPFLMGAQATRWNPKARGVLFGLTLGHTYGDVARSILEGISFEIRACIRVLSQRGMDPRMIIALGGAAKSSIWNQMKADVTGRTYSKPIVTGAASLGAMMLGRRGCGMDGDPTDKMNPIETRWFPNPALSPIYEKAFLRYERLYEANAAIFSGEE